MFFAQNPDGNMSTVQKLFYYSWGNAIASANVNYNWDGGGQDGNDFKKTRDVVQYSANPWGFFDMHGNVWERTADWFQEAFPTGQPGDRSHRTCVGLG